MVEDHQQTTSDRKKHILQVAQKIFARHGLVKTTLDDIAMAVGMKKGSLYYYFESKEKIFREVIAQETFELLEQLKNSIANEKTPEKKILRYVKVRLDYFRRMVNLHELSIQVILEAKPIFDKLFWDLRNKETEILSEIIDKAVKQGKFKVCKATEVASAMLTISNAIKFREFNSTTRHMAAEIDYSKVERDTNYILKLIIDGLMKEKKKQ